MAGRGGNLNTSMATLFNLDWANKEVQTLTCARCGNVLWFDDERIES